MKRGSIPLWLIRDLPALIGIALSFWPLMIMVISTGRKAMRGRTVSPHIYDFIMHMLPIAEAQLHYALCRQAWRALGWNVREVKLEHFPPITTWSDVAARFEIYRADMMDLRAAATRLIEGLRETYRIRARVDANTVRAAHAPAFAALRRDESIGIARASATRPSTCRAEAQRRREHERGLTTARGPPTPYFLLPTPHCLRSASF